MPSHHTTIGVNSLEHKRNVMILLLLRSGTFRLRYGTPSGSDKYIRFGLRVMSYFRGDGETLLAAALTGFT